MLQKGRVFNLRIFFGAPFSMYLSGNGFDPEFGKFLSAAIISLKSRGHLVRSAHVREGFGKKLMSPDVCTPLDFEEIKKCDLFIALPSNPPSGGVHIELGWASALSKKILLCLKKEGVYSPLVHGIGSMDFVDTIFFGEYDELLAKLSEAVK